jgi:diguanylate cyclase (GGDEF)-like protein
VPEPEKMKEPGSKSQWTTRAIVLIAIAVIAGAVWVGGNVQRSAGERAAEEVATSNELLTARLDMETGLRGFLITGRERYLEPYNSGAVAYERAMQRAREAGNDEDGAALDQQDRLTQRWQLIAMEGIQARRDGAPPEAREMSARKNLMDRFRESNAAYTEAVERRGDNGERRALQLLVAIIVALGLAGLAVGYFAVDRPAAERRRRRIEQNEFGELLQFASTEREANDLLRRQLERRVPGSDATVLTINNSENRLQAATELDEGSPLAERLPAATPDTCLAVRRGKPFRRRQHRPSLIECELCGETGANSICSPALVGGEIIGSILVARPNEQLADGEVERIEETAALAAPVLGNLRNLAVAETRAVTDSLTGVANSRAATETLKVMAAFAGRSAQPLSAVLVDLDHFKRINDTYGHQIGDEVLAAAAKAMESSIRSSDFIARYGGEEFLILLQGTGKQTAGEVAEKVRRGLAHLSVPGFAGRVTASFGVATLPDDAGEPDGLLRCADEALYAAKHGGRDKVVLHSPSGEDSGDEAPLAPAESTR